MYGIRYLRVCEYVSVSQCATGPVREIGLSFLSFLGFEDPTLSLVMVAHELLFGFWGFFFPGAEWTVRD